MKRFWTYYDTLQSTNPSARFLMFLAMASVFLVGVPLGLYYGANLPMTVGQLVGLVLMATLAWVRHVSMGNGKHRKLLLYISAGVVLLVLVYTALSTQTGM